MGEGAGLRPPCGWGSRVRTSVPSRSQRPMGCPMKPSAKIKRPVLVLSGTRDQSDAGDRYRTLLPDCHFIFVYDAGHAIGAERPEALASNSSNGAISSSSAGRAACVYLESEAENSRSSALRR
jgi:pimeloyl-ACP methyl ester carboxylesterase